MPGRALLRGTGPCRFFSLQHPVNFHPALSAIDTLLFAIEPIRFPTSEGSSVKASLDPVLLIYLPWITCLRIGLTIDQTAHQHYHPADRYGDTLHQSLLDRQHLPRTPGRR